MEQITEVWPYDADEHDPLTTLRIPVVSTIHPRWNYLVSICVNENPETMLWHGLRPTDEEAALIRSLIDYERSRYREGYVSNTLDARPFDMDGGFNSITLIKRGEGDWAYRRRTWEYGPPLVPDTFQAKEPPLDLAALCDRIHWIVDAPYRGWVEWKADHSDLFDGQQESGSQPWRTSAR